MGLIEISPHIKRVEPSYRLKEKVDNILTIDRVQYSLDGESFTSPQYHLDAFADLLKARYAGPLWVKYSFEAKELPSHCLLEVEGTRLLSLFLNGSELDAYEASEYESALRAYDVSSKLKEGENEVVLKMDYFQKDSVYYALFGENVTESLRNCLVYDSNIEPIYLKGDFGVYGEFRKGEKEETAFGKNFFIAKQKEEIVSLIEDGFPFFHGRIVLDGEIEAEEASSCLVIEKRFQTVRLSVNGQKVPGSMFSYRFDLSPYLHPGKNKIEIALTISPRNCMGPHHNGGEDVLVGPEHFEDRFRNGDNDSPKEMEEYCFVRTII